MKRPAAHARLGANEVEDLVYILLETNAKIAPTARDKNPGSGADLPAEEKVPPMTDAAPTTKNPTAAHVTTTRTWCIAIPSSPLGMTELN